jgi:hypothetical protein
MPRHPSFNKQSREISYKKKKFNGIGPKMLNTFLSELMTQSKTAFNFGTLLMVLRGRRTRRTRSDFMVPRFSPPELPLMTKKLW